MLTRATSLLIVIGCSRTLSTNQTWCNFINYVKANGGFITGSEVATLRDDQTVRVPFKSYQQVLMENQQRFDMSNMYRQLNNVVQYPTNYHYNVYGQYTGPILTQSPTHMHPYSAYSLNMQQNSVYSPSMQQNSLYSPNMQQSSRFPPGIGPNNALTYFNTSLATQHQVRKEPEIYAESNQPERDNVRNIQNSPPESNEIGIRKPNS